MPTSIRFWGGYILILLPLTTPPSAAEFFPEPVNTVLWISIDGFRPDYLEKAETPFLDQLRKKSAWTDELWPIFPSVTFPSHVSIATGTYPQEHGIVSNTFYDLETGALHRFPNQADLLEAEPIWITAERQGVRTAVLGWPLSYAQTGDVTATYCAVAFDGSLTDQQRLEQTLDLFENDPSLRLLLSYTVSPDREGHRYGTDHPKVFEAVEDIDMLLKTTFNRAISIWENKKQSPDDQFFLVVTSDHGMRPVQTLVHPEKLTGLENDETTQIITAGNIAHLYLSRDQDTVDQQVVKTKILTQLDSYDFVSVWPREEIPEKWNLRHPTRTGDLLLVLEEGYTFNRLASDLLFPLEGTGRSLGTHGYDPETTAEMRTLLVIHTYPESSSEIHLGNVDALQLHATVARILNIEPAPKARQNPIDWLKQEE